MKFFFSTIILLLIIVGLQACKSKKHLYEKTSALPHFEWKQQDSYPFQFHIIDSTTPYDVFFVIRHNNLYLYNNIRVQIQHSLYEKEEKNLYNFKLGTKSTWNGFIMDDIIEHRIKITSKPIILKKENYTFKIRHTMQDPILEHILNIGIRIEKAK